MSQGKGSGASPTAKGSASLEELQKQIDELQKQIAASNKEATLSYQPTPAADNSETMSIEQLQAFNNKLDLPKSLATEISKKGYKARWINITMYNNAKGAKRGGWEPYRPNLDTVMSMNLGKDPEGYLRRGDLVLAVRSEARERAEAHLLEERRKRFDMNKHNKQKADELRAHWGGKAQISQGYEEN